MQTKNLTPFRFGAKVTSLRPRELLMTAVVKGVFTLRPGEPLSMVEDALEKPLTGDIFAEDDDEGAGECFYPSDFSDYKPRADVFVKATCHTPSAKPVRECPVRFSVGAWSKALMVTGPRIWTEKLIGAAVSEAAPFTSMPIRYANAFGGSEYPANPVGKGFRTPDLPNIEDLRDRIRGKGDRPQPAGFGPINPSWPERAAKMGRAYGKKWQKERAPFYAEDFDWTHFNAAPIDQQLEEHLRGDEEIGFFNLHPRVASFTARLPNLRVRVLAKNVDGTLFEAPMALDTLHADLEEERLVLIWRGLFPVREDDLTDVATVLVASEDRAAPSESEAHYRAIIAEFEADPLETERHVPGGKAALAALQSIADDDKAHPERTPRERLEALMARPESTQIGVPPQHHAPFAAIVEKAKAQIAKFAGPTPPVPSVEERARHLVDLRQRLTGSVKEFRSLAERTGMPIEDVDELEKMLADPALDRQLKAMVPPSPEEIGPGKDLSYRNLAGMDLSGRDLTEANLEGAILTGANLGGAKLCRAILRQAVFSRADLADADASGADLSKALFNNAKAPRFDLRGAKLDKTLFDSADLRGADFSGAKGEMTLLSSSDLSGAKFTEANLFKAFGDQCVIEGADFAGGEFRNAAFLRARARRVSFAQAMISNACFLESDLTEATFAEARGEAVNFTRAIVADATFRLTVLPNAHFLEADGTGARFEATDLRHAEFYRAKLDRADFRRANLFGTNLNKTSLNGARFDDASLYDARFLGASGKGAEFAGANLKKAMLPT